MPKGASEPIFDDENPEWTEVDFASATKSPKGLRLKELPPSTLAETLERGVPAKPKRRES